jgi:hypothetical protein
VLDTTALVITILLKSGPLAWPHFYVGIGQDARIESGQRAAVNSGCGNDDLVRRVAMEHPGELGRGDRDFWR